MSDWFSRPLLDLRAVDLDSAARVEYLLCQRFRYEYDAPAFDVRQRLVAVPRRRHGSLHLRAHHVDVAVTEPGPWSQRRRLDRRGNTVVDVHVAEVRCAVEFTLAAIVHRDGPPAETSLPMSSLRDRAHLQPTALTNADAALQAMAVELRSSTADDAEFAERACTAVNSGMTYDFGATTVDTTAAQAWAIGRGVCQDSAHVLLAVCRAAGVPARYVSGHLLGQLGGSHAWVEVLVAAGAAARAIGVDPSNGCPAGPRHLPVAVGRDYRDVAPTSGSYLGRANGRLTSAKHAGVTSVVEDLFTDIAL